MTAPPKPKQLQEEKCWALIIAESVMVEHPHDFNSTILVEAETATTLRNVVHLSRHRKDPVASNVTSTNHGREWPGMVTVTVGNHVWTTGVVGVSVPCVAFEAGPCWHVAQADVSTQTNGL
jgi:hypothetical protein